MKTPKPCVLLLSLLALAACRSSEKAPTTDEPKAAETMTVEETIEEVPAAVPELDEESIEEVVPVSMPEVRYYEIADT